MNLGKGTSNGRMLCHWCHRPCLGILRTTPAYTRYPNLPAGTGVIVCGASCPDRPDGAPVGERLVSA